MDDLSVSLSVLLTYLVINVRIKIRCSIESVKVKTAQCPVEITHYPHQLLSELRVVNLNVFSGSHTLQIF